MRRLPVLPDRSARFLITQAMPIALVLLFAAPAAVAQSLVGYSETTSFSSGLPEGQSLWSRVGSGVARILSGGELLLNDNSSSELVAYQGLLGQIEAEHDVVFQAEMKVISNLGGEAALVEISRPGMEVLVQLYPEGVIVAERVGRKAPRWLGSVDIDLSEFRQVTIHKTSALSPEGEEVTITVDGEEVLSVHPRGGGELGLGRVIFGSLGYADLGATIWRWVSVATDPYEQKLPALKTSIGRIKGAFVN